MLSSRSTGEAGGVNPRVLRRHARFHGRCIPGLTASGSPLSKLCFPVLLVLLTLLGSEQSLFARGNEVVHRDEDIVLTVDSRWPGNAYGGYFPLRMKLSNMGPPRDLVLVYEGRGSGRDSRLPQVRRAVRVEQQATINFTLSIPVVSKGTEGRVRVYDASGELKALGSNHSLPECGSFLPRTSLLVISTLNLDEVAMKAFEDAAATEYAYLNGIWGGVGSTHTPSSMGYSSGPVDQDHLVIPPGDSLPVNWVDYSGVDLIAVAWPDWNSKISATQREAILKWAASGGVLILFGTEQPAAKSEELNRSLQLGRGAEWSHCLPESHHATNIIPAETVRMGSYMPPPAGSGVTAAKQAAEAANLANAWKIGQETYSHRDWMLGKIYVFPINPFPGTAADWSWWLASLPKNMTHWPKKMGISARGENNEFLNFLIPGVGSVPVFAFLALITVFTVVIGPLNYYWLHKRRRLAAMVFTVPLIAAVTCLLLFAYSMVSDGFSVRSRIYSFTWLDQERKSAVSLSRLCLYAPFAPSAGLTFSPECAVFPIWPSSSGFEGGILDWSGNDQRLTAGWFRSQTWTQFETIEPRDERGRLDYTPPADPNAEVITASNGLSWDLEYLAINTSDSNWYVGEKIPAGATAQLKRQPGPEVRNSIVKSLELTPWQYPEGVRDGSTLTPTYGRRTYRGYGFDSDIKTFLAQSLLKRNLPSDEHIESVPRWESVDWRDGKNTMHQQPHAATLKPHYWAICRKNPGIQTGVKYSINRDSAHVLFGTF